jgi:hypothetical protein
MARKSFDPYVVERRARRIMNVVFVVIVVVTASCWLCLLGVLVYGR